MRAWNAQGYHKDILVIDSDQVRMHHNRVKESGFRNYAGPVGVSMTIDPKEFPEMVEFQIIVVPY